MVPGGVEAVVIHHGVPLRPPHGGLLLRAERRRRPRRRHRLAVRGRVRGAPADLEAGEPRHERLVPVVGAVPSAVGGPVGGVPDGAVRPHLPVRERGLRLPLVPPDGHVVHQEPARRRAQLMSFMHTIRLVDKS